MAERRTKALAPTAPPLGAPASIAALGSRSCRWPLGDPLDPGFRFCGARTGAGFSYCPKHHDSARGNPAARKPQRDKGKDHHG